MTPQRVTPECEINKSDSDEQKRLPVFQEKIGVTPSVAAPGDIHPSDATDAVVVVLCDAAFPTYHYWYQLCAFESVASIFCSRFRRFVVPLARTVIRKRAFHQPCGTLSRVARL